MQPDSIIINFLIIFTIISFFITLTVHKLTTKNYSKLFLDTDYNKPQAFHKEAVPRSGGTAAIISLLIFYLIYYLIYKEVVQDYIVVSVSLFFLGFLDAIKINVNPKIRLLLMTTILAITIYLFSFDISGLELNFLNYLIENSMFKLIFITLCFLFIINGSNLVDGFNGLLAIHLIIINVILLYINTVNDQIEFAFLLTGQIIVLFSFLLFNFPKAKIFLGDGGAYFFGAITALNIINTNNLNPGVSSFFFCVILFYLFYEVFFSFFRKLYFRSPPLKPDGLHLHMLIFRLLNKINISKNNNYLTSLIINAFYAISILPAILFNDNSLLCRILFFVSIGLYTLIYINIYNKKKNE